MRINGEARFPQDFFLEQQDRVLDRSRKLTKRQIICQSANYLSFYKAEHL